MESLTRGELARRAAVHPETIRFYERSGVLAPPPRSPAGYRLFPPAAVEQLALVKSLRQLGFSLGEIRRLMTLRTGPAPLAARLERQLADLDHGVRELRELLEATWRRHEQSGRPLPAIEARTQATNGSDQAKSGEPLAGRLPG